MKLIKALLDTVEHQFLTLVGNRKGERTVILTDRRITIVERCHALAEPPDEDFVYISSPVREEIDSEKCPMELDKNGLPPWPDKYELISPTEEAKRSSRKVIDPKQVIEVIDTQFAGMAAFQVPTATHTMKNKWMAFRFSEGDMYLRVADEYADLDTADEVSAGKAPEKITEDLSFAVPLEFFRAAHSVYPGKIMMGVKPGKSVAVRVGMPKADILYLCKPLNLTEPVAKEEEEPVADEPTAAELAEEIPGNTEEVEETDEQTTETLEEEATETEGPEEEPAAADAADGSDDTEAVPDQNDGGDGSESGTAEAAGGGVVEGCFVELGKLVADVQAGLDAGDLDPMECLDKTLPEIGKLRAEVVDKCKQAERLILKNVAKQARRPLKGKADPEQIKAKDAEIAELSKKLAKAEKAEAAAKKALKEIL